MSNEKFMACSKLFKFSDFGTVKKQKFARRGIVLKTFYGQENTENIFRTIDGKVLFLLRTFLTYLMSTVNENGHRYHYWGRRKFYNIVHRCPHFA